MSVPATSKKPASLTLAVTPSTSGAAAATSSPPPSAGTLTPGSAGSTSGLRGSLRGAGSSEKAAPKREKVAQMYDVLLRGEDPAKSSFGEHFWNEFFLLRPKVSVLEAEMAKVMTSVTASSTAGGDNGGGGGGGNATTQAAIKNNLNLLFGECLNNLGEEHHIKVVYALQTLCGLMRALIRRHSSLSSTSSGFDLVNLLVGFEQAEQRMQTLTAHINEFLTSEEPSSLKDLCLKLLLVMATGLDSVSQNTLLEYLMMNSVYESLVHLLSHAESRSLHGHSAVLLLTILVQYRKYESANPYVVKLSILDQELALHGYAQVITAGLLTYTKAYEESCADQTSSGWFSSLTSMVGNMFVSEEGGPRVEQMRALNSALLALYEGVHLNRNFIAVLAHYQADSQPSPLPTPRSGITAGSSSTPATPTPATVNGADPAPAAPPNNLLVTFLEYCSIVMQDTKTESSHNTVKLSFLILLCVTEDQYANALMHDPNLVFRVRVHRAPMRHRKPQSHAAADAGSKCLATAVLDLMVEFVRSHMMKRLPQELYLHSLRVVHRLLAYQKRSRVRLGYPWKELWTSLIGLLKFIVSNESNLVKKMNIYAIALQVVVIFNLFITYGDTFLPSPNSYDELYYELVRCHQTFDSLYSMALRYSTGGGEHKESAVRLTNYLVNIRAITAHFNPKINAWLAKQQLSTPTEEQILEVVKSNYDSLTLKLQDGLDQYENYSESPAHSSFFTGIVKSVVADTRQQVVINDLELQAVLQDFSTIQ